MEWVEMKLDGNEMGVGADVISVPKQVFAVLAVGLVGSKVCKVAALWAMSLAPVPCHCRFSITTNIWSVNIHSGSSQRAASMAYPDS